MSTTYNISDSNNTGKQPPSTALLKWLKQQAAKLTKLVRRGWKLQADYLENAREQGAVLAEVRRRLEGTDLAFADWVREETDIGVSTAYLWCDVAEWWDDPCLQELLKNSNPLELTLRQVRDAIRDARQAQGGGKPGCGRRRAAGAETSTSMTSADGVGETDHASDQEEADETGEQEAPDHERWEREVAKAEAEAAEVGASGKTEPAPPLYRITVMVFSDADQNAMYQGLLDWSPVRKTSLGTKQLRSVSAGVGPQDIGRALEKLGRALAQSQPKKLRVSIEL